MRIELPGGGSRASSASPTGFALAAAGLAKEQPRQRPLELQQQQEPEQLPSPSPAAGAGRSSTPLAAAKSLQAARSGVQQLLRSGAGGAAAAGGGAEGGMMSVSVLEGVLGHLAELEAQLAVRCSPPIPPPTQWPCWTWPSAYSKALMCDVWHGLSSTH